MCIQPTLSCWLPLMCRALSYQPPSEDLVEALVQLVRYVTVVEDVPRGAVPPRSGGPGGGGVVPAPIPVPRPAQQPLSAASSWLPESPLRTSPPVLTPMLTAPLPAGTLLAGPSSSPAVQAMSRKLYRFLRWGME